MKNKLKNKMEKGFYWLCRKKMDLTTVLLSSGAGAFIINTQIASAAKNNWDSTTSKNPENVVSSVVDIIVNIMCLFAAGAGIIILIKGIQNLSAALSARDTDSAKTYILEMLGGVLMVGAGVFAKFIYEKWYG